MKPTCITCGNAFPCSCEGSEAWQRVCDYAKREKWRRALPVLVHNLAIAAGLCAAFEMGYIDGADYVSTTGRITLSGAAPWRPGCGHGVP